MNFTGNPENNGTIFFIIEEAHKTFFQKQQLRYYDFIVFYYNIKIK